MQFKLGKHQIWESNNVKLLCVKVDNKLKFDKHISNIWLKVNRKLSVLTGYLRFLSLVKRHTLFKVFIESQFKYYPLV